MTTNKNLTVVIPTYNSEILVAERVEELQRCGLDRIIVCDDGSTDNTVALLEQRYGTAVKVLSGTKNVGPGGNRNRSISEIVDGNPDSLTLFIDADCKLIYEGHLTQLICDAFAEPKVGIVGFGITNKANEPMAWNYGELMHPIHEAADTVLEAMLKSNQITEEQFIVGAPQRAASFRLLPEPGIKQVGWVSEACFAVRASLFKRLGGFATSMRYHETHDFSARVHDTGYQILFQPTDVVQHLAYDSRAERRTEDERAGRLYYYQKHWGMSEKVFKRLFEE